jgi:hypothetical protein
MHNVLSPTLLYNITPCLETISSIAIFNVGINVPQYIQIERGKYMIQGFASFNDEEKVT